MISSIIISRIKIILGITYENLRTDMRGIFKKRFEVL